MFFGFVDMVLDNPPMARVALGGSLSVEVKANIVLEGSIFSNFIVPEVRE